MRASRSPRAGLAMLGLVILFDACSSSTLTIGPTPTPVPSVNIAGSWSGTLESSNLAARSVSLTVVQAGNCVDGAWLSADANWRGAISGFASADAYSGQISIERTDGSGRCAGVGTVSGPVDGNTLRWTGSGFTAVGTCEGELPTSIILSLQRQ